MGVGHLGGGGGGELGLEGATVGAAGGGGDLGGDLGNVGVHPVGEYIRGSCALCLWRLVWMRTDRPSSNPSSLTSELYIGYKSIWDLIVPGTYILALSEGASSILYFAKTFPL